MSKNIYRLLSKIRAARQPARYGAREVVKRREYVEPTKTFSEVCGLKASEFPAPAELTGAQMEKISQAFTDMMETWSLGAQLSPWLPAEVTYPLLVSTLERTVDPDVRDIHISFMFCDFEPRSCPFGQACCLCREQLMQYEAIKDELNYSEKQ